MPGQETGFGTGARKRTRQTPHTVVYGAYSAAVAYSVTRGNALIELSEPTAGAGTIRLDFTLTSALSVTASIIAQYSLDGATWNTATSAGSDSGQDSLATSPAGIAYFFNFDTVTDLGIDFKGDVHVRIKVYDRTNQGGDFEESLSHKLSVDNSPLATSLTFPTADYFDKDSTTTVTFTIPNPNEGNSDMHAKLEIDTLSTFNSVDGETPLRVFESRNDQVGWEYDSDGGGTFVDFVHDGIPVISDPTLIGNDARFTIPTEERLDPGTYYARITFGGVTS